MILILDVNGFLYQIYIHKFIWETFVLFFFSSSVMIEGWNFFLLISSYFFHLEKSHVDIIILYMCMQI